MVSLPDALWGVVSHGDGLLLLDWQDGSRRERSWFRTHEDARFTSMVQYHLDHDHDPKIGLVPRRDRHLDNIGEGGCFWASIENPVGARSITAFRPTPTILLRRGRRSVALWWLDRPLPMKANPTEDWLTRGNKRLAYALKANSRHSDPSWLLPVTGLELVDADASRVYTAREVVGRLRDAPVRAVPAGKLRAA